MLISSSSLDGLFTGFKTSFNTGFNGAEATYQKIAMDVTSSTAEEKYAWLGQFPQLREWLGDRHLHSLEAHGYTIVNRDFEVTITVKRNDIEDDRYGIFAPMIETMGQDAKKHPDKLCYGLLAAGFTKDCYDGQPFFDPDHPVRNANGQEVSVSNMQAGAGPTWFLIDGTKPFKPLVFQKRRPYQFVSIDAANTESVFMRKEYLYGADARVNAGYGLWQLAYASKAPLTHENYEAARAAMKAIRGDRGEKLGITPNVLVAPDELEGDARRVISNQTRAITVGEAPDATTVVISNEWAGSAELVITSFL